MTGMDGLWNFEVTGCELLTDGDAVISAGNLSGESYDGRYYWSGLLHLQNGQVLASQILVQDPGRTRTYCTLSVTGTYTDSTARLVGGIGPATDGVTIAMQAAGLRAAT